MKPELSADAFAGLLTYLDSDPERAGERYEDLRRLLNRFFEWRGVPFPEEQTDEVLNRLAKKLSAGVPVRNVGAYAYEIARFVLLEALKDKNTQHASLSESGQEAAVELREETEAKEIRLACLDDCLETLDAQNRELVIDYYRSEQRTRIRDRGEMARQRGLSREALANRVQRLRDKLEKCVIRCVARKSAI